MKSPASDSFQFNLLLKVTNIVLITTHSKAGIKRVYSLANKSKPEGSGRNCMDMDGTLSTILGVKFGRPESTCTCYNFNPSQKLFESAKNATKIYNEEHSNKQSRSNAEFYVFIIYVFVF